MIKVIIADDQVLLRKSIAQIISIDPNISVVSSASSGGEAIEMCGLFHPDIIIMDIEMPNMSGIEALKIIKEKFSDIKVIILTTFNSKDYIMESFLANADGYITKDIEPCELISTIKCVNYGLTVIHESVKEIMIDRFKYSKSKVSNVPDVLSEEEVMMIKRIVDGKSNKELAKMFNYTEGTIKNKVSKIYEKLNISDRLQLAVYAVENGIE